MYGADENLVREVIDYWHLSWPQVLFIANYGVQTDLKAWRMQQANDPHAYARFKAMRDPGKPVRLSPLALFKFFRKYEGQIWEGAEQMGQDIEGSDCTALKFIGGLNGADKIQSLNDIGVLAAKWSIEEVCQRIYQDWEENHESDTRPTGMKFDRPEEEQGEFRDIWAPAPAHEELHIDTGGYDESISRDEDFRLFKNRSELIRLAPGDEVYLKVNPGNSEEKMLHAKVVTVMPHNGPGTVKIYVDDPRCCWEEVEKTETWPVNSYLYYRYTPPEHEELHTDVGDYDESIMKRLGSER